MVVIEPQTNLQLLRGIQELIRQELPEGWAVTSSPDRLPGKRLRPDDIWEISSPSGEAVRLIVEVKHRMRASLVPSAIQQLGETIARSPGQLERMVVASYLPGRTRQVLQEAGVSYADATGNIRIVAQRPALFILMRGSARDPLPRLVALTTLRGRRAGRTVRAFIDFRPPFGVRELADRANLSIASVSRVADLLDKDALIIRATRGGITNVDWEGVIRRWSLDYHLARSNTWIGFIDPRGIGGVTRKLGDASTSDTPFNYALTGSLAAQQFDPVAGTRLVAVYVDDVVESARRLELRPATAGANVFLAEPYDPVVFERTRMRNGLRCVAPSQLAVDLLTGTGRDPAEGEAIINWMKEHEDDWRS